MKPLSARLKDIYTSGDTYTVLSLLKKLIDAIEEFEDEELNKGLFQHKLKFADNKECVVVNTSSEAITSTDEITDMYGSASSSTVEIVSDTVTKII